MAIRDYYDEHEYYVVDSLHDIMELMARNGIYVKISKRYLNKNNHAFIFKNQEDWEE